MDRSLEERVPGRERDKSLGFHCGLLASILASVCLLAGFFFSPKVWAKLPPQVSSETIEKLQAYDEQFLAGAEFELKAEALARIVPYLDWYRVRNKLARRYQFRIRNPDAPPIQVARSLILVAEQIEEERNEKDDIYKSDISDMIPAKDTPEAEFLRNFGWHYDSGRMEFHHKQPFDRILPFLESFYTFVFMAGVEELVMDPSTQFIADFSMHFHLSTAEGDDHEELTKRLNLWLLLKFIHLGQLGAFETEPHHGFNTDIYKRGLLRHSPHTRESQPHRNEYRKHFAAIEEEMLFYLELMKQDKSKAIAFINGQIEEMLTPEAIAHIGEARTGRFLDAFAEELLTEKNVHRSLRAIEREPIPALAFRLVTQLTYRVYGPRTQKKIIDHLSIHGLAPGFPRDKFKAMVNSLDWGVFKKSEKTLRKLAGTDFLAEGYIDQRISKMKRRDDSLKRTVERFCYRQFYKITSRPHAQ